MVTNWLEKTNALLLSYYIVNKDSISTPDNTYMWGDMEILKQVCQ